MVVTLQWKLWNRMWSGCCHFKACWRAGKRGWRKPSSFCLFTWEDTATVGGIFTACESPERWCRWDNVPIASSRHRGGEHNGWNFNLEWTAASRRISTFREWKAQWHEARQNDFDLNLIQRYRPHRTTWLHNGSSDLIFMWKSLLT